MKETVWGALFTLATVVAVYVEDILNLVLGLW